MKARKMTVIMLAFVMLLSCTLMPLAAFAEGITSLMQETES